MDQVSQDRKRAAERTSARAKERLFIGGPIELAWMTVAAQLPGKSLQIGLALWWRRNLTKQNPVKLPISHCMRFGVQTRAGRAKALRRLESADLVFVVQHPNKSPLVTILDAEAGSRP